MRGAVILNSRQPMRPCGQTEWVRATVKAVRWLGQNNMRLHSSVGMQTWELATAAAVLANVPLCMVLPAEKDPADNPRKRFSQEFVVAGRDYFDSPAPSTLSFSDRADFMRKRDEELIRRADLILPISVSPEGTMRKLIERQIALGKEIERRFEVPYRRRSEPIGYAVDSHSINPELHDYKDRYITHWTRTFNNRWPNEKLIDYYRDIIRSQAYPRSALDTLGRIVRSKTIIASSKNMPSAVPTVSFSSLSPAEAVTLMRWRRRHGQMSIEPYGIGILKDIAHKRGIKEVIYVDDDNTHPEEKWLTQSIGKVTDWSKEREYRHFGDVNLGQFSRDQLILFCHTREEADKLRKTFQIQTVPMVKVTTKTDLRNTGRTI